MRGNRFSTILTIKQILVDTRIILHALQENTKVVVVLKDTDVLILLVYAYAKYKPTKEWYMKIDANKFASIKSIVEYLGSNIQSASRKYMPLLVVMPDLIYLMSAKPKY